MVNVKKAKISAFVENIEEFLILWNGKITACVVSALECSVYENLVFSNKQIAGGLFMFMTAAANAYMHELVK